MISMKTQVLCLAAIVALAVGCAEARKDMGASAENDQNVLTGGPVTGTTIKDLPQPVKDALQQRVPTAEIANITKENENGRVVYKISFIQPGTNPTMYFGEDGQVVQNPDTLPNSPK